MTYYPGSETLVDKARSVLNPSFKRQFTSASYVPTAAYSAFDVLGYVRDEIQEGKIFVIPEYRRLFLNVVRMNRDKAERGQISRELVETKNIDVLPALVALGFTAEGDDNVSVSERNVNSLKKLREENKKLGFSPSYMIVIGGRIYNVEL